MVVPIYKKWEANSARIQVIQQEKTVQLVAFFGDFSHGKCMNFALKSTDIFETFTRPGKFAIKIVDAKFALPKSLDDEAAGFVCLDMPDYPGEHDDITLMFDSEKGEIHPASSPCIFIGKLFHHVHMHTKYTLSLTIHTNIGLAQIRSSQLRVENAWHDQRGFAHGVSSEIIISINLKEPAGNILVRYENGVRFRIHWNQIPLF